MVSQLLLNTTNIQLSPDTDQIEEMATDKDIASYHACLVANYMSYLNAAGYSKLPQEIRKFEQGDWRFLAKYPDPKE